MRLQHRTHPAVGGDGCSHAGVRGTQHGSRRFERAHAGDLQVLA